MKVLADTNALIYAIRNKIDLSDLDLIVPKQVLRELKTIKGKGADKALGKLAAQIFAREKTVDLGEGHVDFKMIDYAKKHNIDILTNDNELKKLAKDEGIKILTIGKRKILGNS